jgi:cytochrome c551/c552
LDAVPLAAISTENKVALAVAAAIFIVFALVCALLVPRRWPDFPGRYRGLFIGVTVLLFAGMMTSVWVFGKEAEESVAAETETQPAGEQPPPSGEQPPPPPAPTGNAATGKTVFVANGCGACHAFQPAGATATVGPNLSVVLQGKDAAFIRESVVDPNAEIAQGYQAGIMPDNFGTQISTAQLNDLIAFLQS